MKKIVKNIFFAFLLFSSIFAQNNIDFLELNPKNLNYQIFEKEINSLKNNNPNLDVINLDDGRNKNLAPKFINQIIQMVQDFVEVSKIKMPALNLYVGASEKTYNASATTSFTKITTIKTIIKDGQINKSTKEEFEKDYKLTLGENLIKLFFWNKNGSNLLQSIIAHEIGHMYYSHIEESKQSEYQADAKAIALLEKNKGRDLINAIDMATLSGHIYNILISNAFMFRISLDEINHLIRVIVNTIVKENSKIGELGICSSHLKFGYVMNKVFQDALKKSFDLNVGLVEKDILEIYQELYLACADLKSFMGSDENDFMISSECAYIEEYTNRLYSNVTHPTPFERRRHLEICIS